MDKNDIIKLLDSFDEARFVKECINELNLNKCIVKFKHPLFDRKRHYSVLSKRVKNVDDNYIQGLKDLVLKLDKSESKSIALLEIATDLGAYSVYLDEDWKSLIGIVFNRNVNREKYLSIEKQSLARGNVNISRWQIL